MDRPSKQAGSEGSNDCQALPPNPLGRHRHCHRNLVEPAATVNRLKEMQTSEKAASPLLPRAYYAVKQRPGDRVEAAVSIAGDSDHAN